LSCADCRSRWWHGTIAPVRTHLCGRSLAREVVQSRRRRSTSPAPGNESRLRRRARRGRWRLIGQDRQQASDQAERWSLVTRPVTRLSTISAAQARYSLAFAAAQLRNPGGQGLPPGARPTCEHAVLVGAERAAALKADRGVDVPGRHGVPRGWKSRRCRACRPQVRGGVRSCAQVGAGCRSHLPPRGAGTRSASAVAPSAGHASDGPQAGNGRGRVGPQSRIKDAATIGLVNCFLPPGFQGRRPLCRFSASAPVGIICRHWSSFGNVDRTVKEVHYKERVVRVGDRTMCSEARAVPRRERLLP